MANIWKKPCNHKGCPEIIEHGQRFCEQHRKRSQAIAARINRRENSIEQGFYNSIEWRTLSKRLRSEEPFCRSCILRGRHTFANVSDHIIPLKLAWDMRFDRHNIQSLCHQCHNSKRAMEGEMFNDKVISFPVTLVCGAPCSGKSTYVTERWHRGHAVVDVDAIFQAVSGCQYHENPETLLPVVLDARNAVLARLCLMASDRPTTWIIACAPTRKERDVYRGIFPDLRVHVMPTPKEECIQRAYERTKNSTGGMISYANYRELILDWFRDYEEE